MIYLSSSTLYNERENSDVVGSGEKAVNERAIIKLGRGVHYLAITWKNFREDSDNRKTVLDETMMRYTLNEK